MSPRARPRRVGRSSTLLPRCEQKSSATAVRSCAQVRERALATVSFEAQEAPHNRPETVPSRRSLQFQNAILIPRGEAGVSSKTGLGLEEIKGALIRLMNSKEVFPDVGTVMPLSYGLLMHLAAGEAELPEAGASCKENRTKWERDIAERVARKEGAHLCRSCARGPCWTWPSCGRGGRRTAALSAERWTQLCASCTGAARCCCTSTKPAPAATRWRAASSCGRSGSWTRSST